MAFLATCCPGLEDILRAEAEENGLAPTSVRRGGVFFAHFAGAPTLRCADNLYESFGRAEAGRTRNDLPALSSALAALCADRLAPGTRVHVSASRTGKHSYSRFEAADAVRRAICMRCGCAEGSADAHDTALRLDIQNGDAFLYRKLTDASFRFRGMRTFAPAAVRPTIAAALVRLTAPCAEDAFLDPFCGSGTLLCERAMRPYRVLYGSDISEDALAAARANVPQDTRLSLQDACALRYESGALSAIASNPPWGMQIAVDDAYALYASFLAEAARILSPSGRLVLLTDRVAETERGAENARLVPSVAATVSLHGTVCRVYALTRI